MVNKNRIVKAELYTNQWELICVASKLEFPKDYFSYGDSEFVVFKSKEIMQVEAGTVVHAVFYYYNGMRVRYLTQIDLCTDFQVNIHVGSNYEVMEERRKSYKVQTKEPAQILQYTENGTVTVLMEPGTGVVENINIGGVFLVTSFPLDLGMQAVISILDAKLEVSVNVLRKQNTNIPGLIGYGCQFVTLTMAQEETISRYIFACQQRDKNKYLT